MRIKFCFYRLHAENMSLNELITIAANGRPLHLAHEWKISLDAEGKVVALTDDGSLKPALRDPLERAIHNWIFDPGHVAGRPAPTETGLTVDISVVPAAGGNYAVRVDDARTGGSISPRAGDRNAMPRFPADAVRPNLAVIVVVKADYDENGRVVSVESQSSQGIGATRSLEAATVAAVKKWIVSPERVDGHGIASSVMVPVCYTVSRTTRIPDFDCSWKPPGSNSKIDNGSAFALESVARLRSDVIGHAL
jgi:hypothetical protein